MATMASVRRIAWSLYWKASLGGLVLGGLVGFLFGFIIGLAVGPTRLQEPFWINLVRYGSLFLGLAVSFLMLNFFLAKTIGKQFGGRRIELIDSATFGER